jgi:replicative DNA helicase
LNDNILEGSDVLEGEVLGTVFLEPTLANDFLLATSIDLFRQPKNKNIYKMIRGLVDKGHDVNLTNVAAIYTKHLDLVGGIGYLTEIASAALSGGDLDRKIKQLVELDARRKGMELIKTYWKKFDDPSEGLFEELLDDFEQKALKIRPKTQRENKNVDMLVEWYEGLVEKANDPKLAFGILTGWEALDRLTLGFQRTNLIVIGARTSMGKTAFANEIQIRASRKGHKVASFSLEMIAGQIYNRMAANICGIPMQNMRTGQLTQDQLRAIADCIDGLRKLHLDDTRGVSAEYICSEMRRLKRQNGLDLVLVDYIQEIVEPGERNDHGGSAMQRVSQKLRKAAQDCDCALIALSQVKQEVEARANKRPFMSDLFGGAALGAVADDVIMLYRDDYYNPDTEDKDIMEVNLIKQRNGPTGLVKLHYDKSFQRISSITTNYEQPKTPGTSNKKPVPDMYRGKAGKW